jgi:hypothetical protein
MNEIFTYGLDYRGGEYIQVCADNTKGRPRVESLKSSETTPNFQELKPGQLVFSVPDSEVIMKYLKLPADIPVDIESAIRFELGQAMLDDNATLAYDYLSSHNDNNYLGFIYRRQKLENRISRFGLNELDNSEFKSDFKTRATALAMGYLAFCHRVEGDLICLADINDSEISIAFIFQKAIVDLASLKLPQNETQAMGKIAIDFKTLVNFKLAALAGRGISQPPSALVIANDTSESPDKSISTALAKYFPAGITRPSFIEEYFPEDFKKPDFPLEKYLVALGLTVN